MELGEAVPLFFVGLIDESALQWGLAAAAAWVILIVANDRLRAIHKAQLEVARLLRLQIEASERIAQAVEALDVIEQQRRWDEMNERAEEVRETLSRWERELGSERACAEALTKFLSEGPTKPYRSDPADPPEAEQRRS